MQFRAPPLTPLNKILVIISASLFVLHSILGAVGAGSLITWLGLSGPGIEQGLVYQLITYPFVDGSLMGFLFSLLVLWFFGAEFELSWGRKTYQNFLLLNVIGVGIFYMLLAFAFFRGTQFYQVPLFGLSVVTYALCTAYAVIFPDRELYFMMIFPMKAKWFAVLLGGIELYSALISRHYASLSNLLAIAISLFLLKWKAKPKRNKPPKQKKKPRANHLKLINKDGEKPPKYWQ